MQIVIYELYVLRTRYIGPLLIYEQMVGNSTLLSQPSTANKGPLSCK